MGAIPELRIRIISLDLIVGQATSLPYSGLSTDDSFKNTSESHLTTQS